MNAFESGARKAIPAVLAYLRSGDRFLMIERRREGDFHEGKWNAIGGKCEADESALAAALREIREEAGLELAGERLSALGVLHFPKFKPKSPPQEPPEDWIVWVWEAELSESESRLVPSRCDEGTLHWVKRARMLDLPLWEGDREFLPLVLKRAPFVGTLWYENGKFARSQLTPLAAAPSGADFRN